MVEQAREDTSRLQIDTPGKIPVSVSGIGPDILGVSIDLENMEAVLVRPDGASTNLLLVDPTASLTRVVSAALHARYQQAQSEEPVFNLEKLSPRELEVISMVLIGMRNQEIATKLGLSVKTVESHKDHIKRKTRGLIKGFLGNLGQGVTAGLETLDLGQKVITHRKMAIYRGLNREIVAAGGPQDFTIIERTALLFARDRGLEQNPNFRLSELSSELGKKYSTARYVANRLISWELLSRTPVDRKSNIFNINEQGMTRALSLQPTSSK